MEVDDLQEFTEEIMDSELFQQGNLYLDDDDNEPDDVIILHMDIREPLRTLQKLIEQKLSLDLKGYKFWLQDAQELEPHKNLVDQCVKGEGFVQINVQIQTIAQHINIVDVLKPTEAALAALAAEESNKQATTSKEQNKTQTKDSDAIKIDTTVKEEDNTHNFSNEQEYIKENKHIANTDDRDDDVCEKPCLNWVLDSKFKKEQTLLKIPDDPNDWTVPQVKHWLKWAVRQFDLSDITLSDWEMTGQQLCSLSHEEFRKKLPRDPGNVFWTHLQLLKECKFVSVVHKVAEGAMKASGSNSNIKKRHSSTTLIPESELLHLKKEPKIMRKSAQNAKAIVVPPAEGEESILNPHNNNASGSAGTGSGGGLGSGNNGQVQLWQFLLEILTDRSHTDIIQWVGSDGEFKLSDPERVARLWGIKKNKPAMNYEKLSRALRYYYDGDMISKVSGKRFAYKFDCDLKLLIGYDAAELSQLVNEKPFMYEATYLEHLNMKSDEE